MYHRENKYSCILETLKTMAILACEFMCAFYLFATSIYLCVDVPKRIKRGLSCQSLTCKWSTRPQCCSNPGRPERKDGANTHSPGLLQSLLSLVRKEQTQRRHTVLLQRWERQHRARAKPAVAEVRAHFPPAWAETILRPASLRIVLWDVVPINSFPYSKLI